MGNRETAIKNGKKGGRPKGARGIKTLEKEKVLAAVRERIMQNADLILDSQLSIARGVQFLYKIEKELQVGPKGGKRYVKSKPKLVTDQWEIEAYLEGKVDEGDMDDESDPDATYYFITTKEPNNMAMDSMFNRAFGKPTEVHELGGIGGGPIKITDKEREEANKDWIKLLHGIKSGKKAEE